MPKLVAERKLMETVHPNLEERHNDKLELSPTSSTNSSGPKTPKGELNEDTFYHPNQISKQIVNPMTTITDTSSTKSVESDKNVVESDSLSTNYAIPYSRKPQRTSMETNIKLKIRYVARDLWQTVTFQNTLTVAQVRDICLIKCGLMQANDLNISETNSYNSSDNMRELSVQLNNSNDTNNLMKDRSWRSEYALFWNAAGHWLDDFRRLNSYNLRALDVLELQVRNEFIFIQPSMYLEHYAEGYLYKLRNGINPSWRSRWFVLQGRNIWYFKKRKDPNPSGSADLSHPFQVQETSATPNLTNQTESCLMLKFNDKCWWLKAMNLQDLDHWRRIFINLHREVNDHCAANYSNQPVTQTSSKSTAMQQTESDDGSFHLNTSENGSINSNDESNVGGAMRIKAGFMYRRQPITHGYKERYFVLRGKELSCYKSDRFDKSNNPAKVISLHTVDVVAYTHLEKYYFQIKDKQAAETNFLQGNNKPKKAGTDFKSIISSTKSLPMKVNSWISQTNGAQLNTEYLYVEESEDWQNWKIAFESIANLEIEIKDFNDLNKKELKSSAKTTRTSNTTSSFLSGFGKLGKGNKTKPTPESIPAARTKSDASNRFSAFIKGKSTSTSRQNPSSNNNHNTSTKYQYKPTEDPGFNRYEDIDELNELTPLEFQLQPELINSSQLHVQFPPSTSSNLLLNSNASLKSNGEVPVLTPLDKLLLEDAREKERNLSRMMNPAANMFGNSNLVGLNSTIDARSSCSAPSENLNLENKVKSNSGKFLWFKRK